MYICCSDPSVSGYLDPLKYLQIYNVYILILALHYNLIAQQVPIDLHHVHFLSWSHCISIFWPLKKYLQISTVFLSWSFHCSISWLLVFLWIYIRCIRNSYKFSNRTEIYIYLQVCKTVSWFYIEFF